MAESIIDGGYRVTIPVTNVTVPGPVTVVSGSLSFDAVIIAGDFNVRQGATIKVNSTVDQPPLTVGGCVNIDDATLEVYLDNRTLNSATNKTFTITPLASQCMGSIGFPVTVTTEYGCTCDVRIEYTSILTIFVDFHAECDCVVRAPPYVPPPPAVKTPTPKTPVVVPPPPPSTTEPTPIAAVTPMNPASVATPTVDAPSSDGTSPPSGPSPNNGATPTSSALVSPVVASTRPPSFIDPTSARRIGVSATASLVIACLLVIP
jgi:hypothetical protein